MKAEEIRQLVATYFERSLQEAEDDRADGIGVLNDSEDGEHGDSGTEGLELHLEGLLEDLARGELKGIAHVADSILSEAGLELPKDSHDYRKLCREALKAAIETTKANIERMKGGYKDSSSPPQSSSSSTAAAPVKQTIKLSTALAEYVKEYAASGNWARKTKEETEGVYRLLVGIVGDVGMEKLDHRTLSRFREALSRFPSNHTKRPAYRGKTISEIAAMTAKESAPQPLSVSSINKHIIRTGAFLKWAVKRGYVASNFAEGLTIKKRSRKESEEREAYSKEDLKRLVQSPLASFRKPKPERFWIPIIGLYSGMRLNEICQLHLEDVREIDDILCFDVNDKGGSKRLKNVASRRILPVHPFLFELGFKEYVDALRKKREARLWPGLVFKRDTYSEDFGKQYQRFNRQHITSNSKRVFHSFRHSLADNLKQRGIDGNIIAEILGHSLGSMSLGRYGKGYSPKVLLGALEKLEYGIEEALRKLTKS